MNLPLLPASLARRVSEWFVVLLGVASAGVACGAGPGDPGTGELQVRILEARSGEPVEATVALLDSQGSSATEGEGLRGAFRASGGFHRRLPAGWASLRITRGPEYEAAEVKVEIPAGGRVERDVSLVRLLDLRARGWYAGDSHAHMFHGDRLVPVSFDDVALAARAEDLQLLSLAQMWSLDPPTPEELEAELGRRSHPRTQLTWNLEAPKNYYLGDASRCLGHGWTLGMRGRTPEGADVIARLLQGSAWDYESGKAPVANFESQALIRAQGGAVFYTHPVRWWTGPWGGAGGYPRMAAMRVSNMAVELPLDVLAGPTFDGLDVITGSAASHADEKAFELWSMLLNRGYRLSATASSDACFDRPGGATPGAARLYVHLDEPYSLEAYRRAAVAGRTFATTGPLLLVSLEGKPPGSAFRIADAPRALRIEAWSSGASTGGLARVEVWHNGSFLRRFSLAGHPTSFVEEVELDDQVGTGWICVRAFGSDPRRERAISGAFYLEEAPWHPPSPVPAVVEIRVEDAQSGEPLDAVLSEVRLLGAHAELRPGSRHVVQGGTGRVSVPATVRLRAEAEGYEPLMLSPFLDQPELLELITRMEERDLLDWGTFERVRALLGNGRLTFRMRRR